MPPSYIPENIKWKIHMQILVDQKNIYVFRNEKLKICLPDLDSQKSYDY